MRYHGIITISAGLLQRMMVIRAGAALAADSSKSGSVVCVRNVPASPLQHPHKRLLLFRLRIKYLQLFQKGSFERLFLQCFPAYYAQLCILCLQGLCKRRRAEALNQLRLIRKLHQLVDPGQILHSS